MIPPSKSAYVRKRPVYAERYKLLVQNVPYLDHRHTGSESCTWLAYNLKGLK